MRLPEVGGWSPGAKLLGFAAASAIIAAAAFGVGAGLEPIAAEESAAHGSDEQMGDHSSEDEGTAAEPKPAAAEVAGLAVTDRGYTLVPHDTTFRAGAEVPFAFTVTGPDGAPVEDYRLSHEKELHLIVVERNLGSFQHVHPDQAPDGSWHIPLTFPRAGTYRVFADFAPSALGGDTVTLGADASVAGSYAPTPLPAPSRTARVDDFEVTLAGRTRAGQESELTFSFTRDGEPVRDLEPYLGAFGHLVSLRSGDLAYLHTHPIDEATAGSQGGPEIKFGTTFPTPGRYRLFVDFSHGGQVRTAAFTVDVTGGGITPGSVDEPEKEDGHGDEH